MVVSTVHLKASHLNPQKHRQERDAGTSGKPQITFVHVVVDCITKYSLREGPPYCLQPGPGFVRFSPDPVPHTLDNKFIVFDFKMPLPGTHTLEVYVQCGGLYHRIDLLQGAGAYTLSSFGTGYMGHKCLELYDHIVASENENTFTCGDFKVFFRAHAAFGGTELSIYNVGFMPGSALGTSTCRKSCRLSVIINKKFMRPPPLSLAVAAN